MDDLGDLEPYLLRKRDTELSGSLEVHHEVERHRLLDWQVVFSTRGIREISYFVTAALDRELRRAHERELVERYLDRLVASGVADPPSHEQAWDDYRFFVHDAWDSVALTILWSGLHPPEQLEVAYQRCCVAVEDLAVDEILAARFRSS